MRFEEPSANLPAPIDDEGAGRLLGSLVPSIALTATTGGTVDLAGAGSPWAVVYIFPMTGRPDRDLPENWDTIPGARGCTPQTCAFRDRRHELAALGADVYGLSVQSPEYQAEMAGRLDLNFPVLSDAAMEFGTALGLPTMDVAGMTLYKRLTLIARGGVIKHVMYPVLVPDQNAADVITWITERVSPKADAQVAWDERYSATTELYGAEPNQFVAAELGGASPRKVLDMACGQGRNSVWLATQGHDVTGVDLSDVGIEQARRLANQVGVSVRFQVGDIVGDWEPADRYDVVLLSYLQLPQEQRRIAHAKAMAALAAGGRIFLIAHHIDNHEHGVGGPPMPEVLYSEAQLAADFAEIDIRRNEKVLRTVERSDGIRQAHDVLLDAVKPG